MVHAAPAIPQKNAPDSVSSVQMGLVGVRPSPWLPVEMEKMSGNASEKTRTATYQSRRRHRGRRGRR